MHMRLEDFYALEYQTFMEALYQYHKAEEIKARRLWETTRQLSYYMVLPNLDKSDRHKDMKKLFPLPWDDEDRKLEEALRKPIDDELDRQACHAAMQSLFAICKQGDPE